MKNFSWKAVILDYMTVTKILRCFRTNWRSRFKNKKFVVLAEYFQQQTNCRRYRRKMSQSRRSPSWRNQSYLIFLIKQNGNHATEPQTVGHVIPEWQRKSTFDFTESVNNYGLKRGRLWQIVRFLSQFSLKLNMQFWKYFYRLILGRLGRGYNKKKTGC